MSNTPENALEVPEIIITGHAKADLDALASMVAARKLYPGAIIIAPTYREKLGVNYFLSSIAYIFNFKYAKNCDLSKVKTLVVVDTRQRSRVAHIAEVLRNPGLVIHCFDHHPPSEEDLPAEYAVIKAWGSTTAILIHQLMEKNICVSPDEATMLGLGLYEDTGSFTFSSTTEFDLLAAAWLKPQFMDLSVIADMLNTSMTVEQVSILNRMLENAETHDSHGISIVFTEIVLNEYMEDFAGLVRQMMDMDNTKVIFALAQMGDRVHLVARSRVPELVNVSKICSSFGGGGHSYAAAVSIKDKTIAEIKSELFAMLLSTINKDINVGVKMTSPAKVVEDNHSLAEAEEIMLRYGLKATPIVASGTMYCVGFIEHQIAARAVNHGLGQRPVSEFMNAKVKTVRPEDSLYLAMEIILGQRQRLTPVVDAEDNVIGVLTRTDIMRILLDDSVRIPEGTPLYGAHKERNIANLIKDKFSERHFKLLKTIGDLADKLNVSAFAVGGFVRDLLLDRVNLDIDIAIEGNGITFARELAAVLRGRIHAHHKFQTALVIFTNDEGVEERIDIATARLEYYESPGALPTVELSSIKMDLSRRDFTINALAIKLNTGCFGELVDPFGAQRDIKDKSVRVLHSLSFIEDPTRIMRAIRFEKRFGFRIEAQTEKLIKNCIQLGMFQKISGARVFNELKHIFDEKSPLLCLERMDAFGILNLINPQLKLFPSKIELLTNTEEILSWYKLLYMKEQPENWKVFLMGLCPNAKYKELSEVLEFFKFNEKSRVDFLSMREATRIAGRNLLQWQKNEGKKMGELYRVLRHVPLEGLLHMMTHNSLNITKKMLSHFISRLRNLTLDVTGNDLIDLGAEHGPEIGITLKMLLEAKADGKVETREEQLHLAGILLGRLKNMNEQDLAVAEVAAGRT